MGFLAEEGTTGWLYLRTISGILKLVIIFVSLVPAGIGSKIDIWQLSFTKVLIQRTFQVDFGSQNGIYATEI